MLLEALHQCILDGQITEKEVRLVKESVLYGLNHDGDDTIELNEFVESCSFGEGITANELGTMERIHFIFVEKILRNQTINHSLSSKSSSDDRPGP